MERVTYSSSQGHTSFGVPAVSLFSFSLSVFKSPLVEAVGVKFDFSTFTSIDSAFFKLAVVLPELGFLASFLAACSALHSEGPAFSSLCSDTELTLINGVVLLVDCFRLINAVIDFLRELVAGGVLSSAGADSLSLLPGGFESNDRNGVAVRSSVDDTDGLVLSVCLELAADDERLLKRLIVSCKPQDFFRRSVTSATTDMLTSEDELESKNVEFLRDADNGA